MKAWLKAVNPLATIDGEAEAVRAARASSLSLWLSGLKWIAAAILMIQDMPRIKAAMVTGADSSTVDLVGAGLAEAIVGITAAVGLFQIVIGWVQWRAPTTVIPIIFLILSVYGLGNGLWSAFTGEAAPASFWSTALSYFTLVVAVVFHWAALRGANTLERIRRGR